MEGSSREPGSHRCPRCGGGRSVPVVYGLPDAELGADARAGRVALGGCARDGFEPTRECRSCGHRWRRAEPGWAEEE